MSEIKTVAVAGASGNLGPAILSALIDSEKYTITVLTRESSTQTFPSSVTVKKVNYESADSLAAALQGIDAVVSTLGSLSLATQKLLITTAARVGVKRFIPSEFGCDTLNPEARKLPVFKTKIDIQQVLEETAAADPKFSYTLVLTGPFLDWALAKGFPVDIKGKKPSIVDGGDHLYSTATLATIGKAVAGVLSHPAETKNRAVYVKDLDTTQNQIVALAKKIQGPEGWEATPASSEAIEKAGFQAIAEGKVTPQVMMSFLVVAVFGKGKGGRFEKDDNALLGIKPIDEAGLEAIVKKALEG